MIEDAADMLTPRERECLTLVLEPLDNKEIAAVLGIAPNTVANHIKSAKLKLGASTKRQAARTMRDAYGLKSASQPSAIPPIATPEPFAMGSDTMSGGANCLREEQMPFDTGMPFAFHPADIIVEKTHYDSRSVGYRFVLVLALTVGMSVAFGGLLAGLDAMSRLFRS